MVLSFLKMHVFDVHLTAGHGHPPLVADSFYYNLDVVYEKKGDLENAFVQHQKTLEIQTLVNTRLRI